MCHKNKLFIGTSGWNYKNWKNDFYQGVPQKKWLSHYASMFNSVEVNATFYRGLNPGTYEKWLQETPPEFCFVIKGSRYITHIRRLKVDRDSILKQQDNVTPLQTRLTAVLWQLPANLGKDVPWLKHFAGELAECWPQITHVLEFRNSSWFDEDIAGLMQDYGLVNCLSDAPNWQLWPRVISGQAYVRLHGHTELYRSKYTEDQLAAWANRVRQWLDQDHRVFFFFDNTDNNHAFSDARRLQELMHP